MRWAIALLGCFAAVGLRAEVPLDLDSPFPKVALVKAKTGGVEEREIRKAKKAGGSFEMETRKGSTALFPEADVVAILPRLPAGNEVYGPGDVDRALALLEGLPASLQPRPEASAETLQKWWELKKPAEVAEAKRQEEAKKAEEEKLKREAEAQAAQVQEWMRDAENFLKPRTAEELTRVRKSGEELARANPAQRAQVQEALAMLSQVKPKEEGGPFPDWSKLTQATGTLMPEPMLGWLAGGVVLGSFFGLLLGLLFVSSGLTALRSGGWLGGLVSLILGAGLWGGTALLWIPQAQEGEPVAGGRSAEFEKIVPYLAHGAQPAYYLPTAEAVLAPEELAAGMQSLLPPSEEPVGAFKAKFGEGVLAAGGGRWSWRQPITALGLPVAWSITVGGPLPGLPEWSQPTIDRVEVGRIALPAAAVPLVAGPLLTSLGNGAQAAGLSRIALEAEGEKIRVKVPASGKKPVVELAEPPSGSVFRKEISAEELAQAIVQRQGQNFLDKFVLVRGRVHSVGGSNFSSYGKIGRDQLDEIYLVGIEDFYGRERPLLIKCQIKSDCIFQVDNRGDLYVRYVKQEFEQDRKKKAESAGGSQENRLKFLTLDGQEVSGPGVDTAKERPLVSRGKLLQFLGPLRVELKAEEIKSGTVQGGISGRPPGTNQAGHLELYGLSLAPDQKVETVMMEVE